MDKVGTCRDILVGVGAVIWNDRSEVLLIRRAHAPRLGEWSLPGGKMEPGETLHAALRREVREETGLEVEILELIGVAELAHDAAGDAPDSHYVLIDYSARVISGRGVAASDAAEAHWFSVDELPPLWDETRRMIVLSAEKHLA
jgi:8-oxo-dGTP diphosphatase